VDIIIATRNQGKAREIEALLQGFSARIQTMDAYPDIGEIEETGRTFTENALLKARTVAQCTGHAALADDSGLEVSVLGGEPGVFSARYSGKNATDQANNALLLRNLTHVPWEQRQARFVCVIAVHVPGRGSGRDQHELVVQGQWSGRIAPRAKGDQGFGYDPLFWDDQLQKTAAQMSPEEKNARSHRAAALRELVQKWPDFMRSL